jgi:hypothetical protein
VCGLNRQRRNQNRYTLATKAARTTSHRSQVTNRLHCLMAGKPVGVEAVRTHKVLL